MGFSLKLHNLKEDKSGNIQNKIIKLFRIVVKKKSVNAKFLRYYHYLESYVFLKFSVPLYTWIIKVIVKLKLTHYFSGEFRRFNLSINYLVLRKCYFLTPEYCSFYHIGLWCEDFINISFFTTPNRTWEEIKSYFLDETIGLYDRFIDWFSFLRAEI